MSRLLVEGGTLLGLADRRGHPAGDGSLRGERHDRARSDRTPRVGPRGRGSRSSGSMRAASGSCRASSRPTCTCARRSCETGPKDLELLPWLTYARLAGRSGARRRDARGLGAPRPVRVPRRGGDGHSRHGDGPPLRRALPRRGARRRPVHGRQRAHGRPGDDAGEPARFGRGGAGRDRASAGRLARARAGTPARRGAAALRRHVHRRPPARAPPRYAAEEGLSIHTHASENRGGVRSRPASAPASRTSRTSTHVGLLTPRTCSGARGPHRTSRTGACSRARRRASSTVPSSNLRLSLGRLPGRRTAPCGRDRRARLGRRGLQQLASIPSARCAWRRSCPRTRRAGREPAGLRGPADGHLGRTRGRSTCPGPEGLAPRRAAPTSSILDPEAGWSLPDELGGGALRRDRLLDGPRERRRDRRGRRRTLPRRATRRSEA